MNTRAEKIASILTEAILDHRLLPGSKLGERELAEVFGVSRIVIRQALVELTKSSLVKIERNRGAFVARPSLQEALEIYDTLTMIEQYTAGLVANRIESGQMKELKRLVKRQKEAADESKIDVATKLGKEFHRNFVKLSGNRVLGEIHTQLLRRASLISSLYKRSFDACNFVRDHELIIELTEKGQAKEAKDLIQNHNHMIARSHDMSNDTVPHVSLHEVLRPYVGADSN